jgi:hypothetical protein
MAEENQPPLQFKKNEKAALFFSPEYAERMEKYLADLMAGSSNVPGESDPSPIPGTSAEHIPSPTINPTLFDYLLPRERNYSQCLLSPVVCALSIGSISSESKSTGTESFAPRHLDRKRLPFHVSIMEDLHANMRSHMFQILHDGSARFQKLKEAPSEESLANFRSLKALIARYSAEYPLSSEADVKMISWHIVLLACSICEALEDKKLRNTNEVTTPDKMVRTDQIVYLEPTSPIILWEDKSVSVGNYYLPKILERLRKGPVGFDEDKSRKWDGMDAMLLKVRN